MSHASTAFAFSDPAEPQVLAAARTLAARLAADQAISRLTVNATMADHFGGSDAEGRWSSPTGPRVPLSFSLLARRQGQADSSRPNFVR